MIWCLVFANLIFFADSLIWLIFCSFLLLLLPINPIVLTVQQSISITSKLLIHINKRFTLSDIQTYCIAIDKSIIIDNESFCTQFMWRIKCVYILFGLENGLGAHFPSKKKKHLQTGENNIWNMAMAINSHYIGSNRSNLQGHHNRIINILSHFPVICNIIMFRHRIFPITLVLYLSLFFFCSLIFAVSSVQITFIKLNHFHLHFYDAIDM